MLRKRPVLIPLALACTLLITLAVTATPEGVPFKEIWDAIKVLQESSVPDGTIAMWSGKISDIPAGWALCDGSYGTPDLRARFVMSVTVSEEPGGKGGNSSHGHSASVASSGSKNVGVAGLIFSTSAAPPHSHSHGISTVNHLPPYYKLAFIMKL